MAEPPSKAKQEVMLPQNKTEATGSQEGLVREMLEIERQRIASQDKKTETARMFIEAQDASDKRQFEFSMDKLNRDDDHRKKRHTLAKVVIYVGGGALLVGVFGLLAFMFFGSAGQSELAITALKTLFVGGAGYGLISGIVLATRRLLNNQD